MEAREYIDQFDILLFDMGNTFMFGGDRFGPGQDYEKTYQSFGGRKFNNDELHRIFKLTYGSMLEMSRDPSRYDSFMPVRQYLDVSSEFRHLSGREKDLIEQTFAYHECGRVPSEHKTVLHMLSKSHLLGVVSNIWCSSNYFNEMLAEEGVHKLFKVILYSSDHGSVKPSSVLFKKAAELFSEKPSKIVHIGDSYKRDVLGAKKAGMKSILVNNNKNAAVDGRIKPNMVITGLEELV